MTKGVDEPRKKKGKKASEKLKFLATLTNNLKLTDQQIAEMVGCARQTVQHMWAVDNCMFDRVLKIIDACGYEAKFSLEDTEPRQQGKAYVTIDEIMKESNGEIVEKRLSFLKLAFMRTGLTIREIAKKLDMSENTIFYYFRTDNTDMDFINKFADTFGFRFYVKLKKKEDNSQSIS